ncbi:MAG: spore coat protein CotJB [Acutalibacteraceae bacterium]
MDDKRKLMARISACRFAQKELMLFLDTHPDCCEAMKALNMHRENAMKLKEEYESRFGPISNPKGNCKHWEWVDDPWPWDYVPEAAPYNSGCGRCGKGACR